jgi:hypothetical protein
MLKRKWLIFKNHFAPKSWMNLFFSRIPKYTEGGLFDFAGAKMKKNSPKTCTMNFYSLIFVPLINRQNYKI